MIHKRIYLEKFPAGNYELKISCGNPVTWSGEFCCPASRCFQDKLRPIYMAAAEEPLFRS